MSDKKAQNNPCNLKTLVPEMLSDILIGQQPWEQRPDESVRAFQAFKAYRDMGMKRSLTAAYTSLTGRKDAGRGRYDVWSKNYDWVARCQAYDRWLDYQYTHRKAEEVKEMAERHSKIATIFLNKVIAKLQRLDPETLSNEQLIKWLDIATKIERIARGDSIENMKKEVSRDANKIDLSKLTDDEFDTLQSIIVRRFDSRKLVGGIGQEKKGEPSPVR